MSLVYIWITARHCNLNNPTPWFPQTTQLSKGLLLFQASGNNVNSVCLRVRHLTGVGTYELEKRSTLSWRRGPPPPPPPQPLHHKYHPLLAQGFSSTPINHGLMFPAGNMLASFYHIHHKPWPDPYCIVDLQSLKILHKKIKTTPCLKTMFEQRLIEPLLRDRSSKYDSVTLQLTKHFPKWVLLRL